MIDFKFDNLYFFYFGMAILALAVAIVYHTSTISGKKRR